MDRKKLIKLGISVLAVNALGAVAVYKYPELTHVPTVYAEEVPGEDEEIPDAAEAQAAANFKNQMDEFEEAIKEFNPDDSDTREGLEIALGDLEASHTTAVNAIKSEEGKKGFAKYEARYQALKAKAQALLNGESPKPQPDPQPQPQPDPQPQPKITTQDLTVKEPILYGSSTEQNSALPKGTRKTKVQGVNGEKEVVYTITYTDGKETGRVKKSETVIKPAVDEVIEEGTGAVITTKEETKTEEVEFQVKEVPNPALPEGVRNVTTPGKKGVRTIVETVTYTDGKETGRVVKSNEITTPAVDEVVEVGTKKAPVVTTKEETKTEEVDFQVKEVPNPALPEGVRNVTTPGKKGVRTIVETVTYTDGKETGRVVKSNEITTPAVDEVVEVGTKKGVVTTTEEVVEKEVIKHGSSTVQNPALPKGTRNLKVQGVDGEKEVTYTVTKADGQEVSKVKKSETVTKPAVDEVIEEGTGPVITTKEETKTEEVDFQVKEVPNPALPEGVRNVTTSGKKGVRTIVYTVTYADGVETGRVEKSNTITTPAVDEVVEVGTKKATAPVVTTENVTETQVIYHGTITLSNPDLPKGTKRIKIAGVDGEKTVVYTITKTNGVETSRVVRDEQITKTPITQVVEIGTKESGSSQSNASQDQKDPSDKAQDSKGQGQKDSTGKVQDPKDQAKPGSDAATSSQSGQTDRPQQPQYSRVNRNAEEKKNLPNTGEHANGLVALLGLVLASVTAFFNFRRKKH
ncbi:G5 domain-containing protein [Streptococcus gordonii]|uniref:G5 domain-containing protein n=2 Tax=Streptococcus gordonii TaxID=1302 RepID=UPI002283A28F|nr:G5 domain-containing protein [Streptococcus gordonii]MCY7144135.1 G5 domain-containing protein [Streptococcus gordonii]MCY7168745.1 G5 domain-containing protein [Streptococcus gordonii]